MVYLRSVSSPAPARGSPTSVYPRGSGRDVVRALRSTAGVSATSPTKRTASSVGPSPPNSSEFAGTRISTAGGGIARPMTLWRSVDTLNVQTQQFLVPSIEWTIGHRLAAVGVPAQTKTDSSTGSTCNAGGSGTPHEYVTIVFDLDETLCNNRRAGRALLRPGAIDILNSLRDLSSSDLYVELILWTASMESVAKPVVQRLDPHGTVFDHLIYRDRRWSKESGYTKDLRRLGRDMSQTIIVENSPLSVQLNRKHAILVKDFLGGPATTRDTQLHTTKAVLSEWIAELHQGSAGTKQGDISSAEESLSTPLCPAPGPSPTAPPRRVQTYPSCSIVEFLTRHPHISAGNELITVYPRNALTGGTPLKESPNRYQRLTTPSKAAVSSTPLTTAPSPRSNSSSPRRVFPWRAYR